MSLRRPLTIRLAVPCALALFVACGGDDSTNGGGADGGAEGGGTTEGGVLGDGGGGGDAGPKPSPFGIDTRPSNTTCLAQEPPPQAGAIALVDAFPMLPALNKPVLILQAPGDNTRFFVVQQGGSIVSFANDPMAATTTPFMTFPANTVTIGGAGEGGLLSIAFHPDWATNHTAFLSYTIGVGGAVKTSVISRIKSSDANATLDLATEEKTFLNVAQPFDNHNGGNMQFGPDGYLYIGFGDGGSGYDPQGNGQNTNTLLAKMLRIGAGPTGAYTIPADNPFAKGGGKPEIFAYGLRNPWRWSFDKATGDLWVGDVGQDTWEEIDKVKLGGNYGWSPREGFVCTPSKADPCPKYADPIVVYPHQNGDKSVTGGYVYRGSSIPELIGTYVFADYGSGHVYSIVYDAANVGSVNLLTTAPTSISSFGQGNDNELYAVGYGNGRIYKVTRAGMAPADTFPKKLSLTGCVDKANPKNPAPGLIPYDVIAPLWSDAADKHRWFAIPDGSKITVNADGDFDFPIGSVLVKEFSLGGKRIETRLMMRDKAGDWNGYSYEWADDESDATLLPAGKSKAVGMQTWSYPNRIECLSCHTQAAGRTLGPELRQLNHDYVYAATNRLSNELATLEHIGVLDKSIGDPTKLTDKLSDPFGNAPVRDRARSYLHGNCSHCHRPMGGGQGPQNFLFTTSDYDANICNVDPTEGDLGVAGAKLFAPADPTKSLISLRMKAVDNNRMPPLGTRVAHTQGIAVIDSWITQTTTCPGPVDAGTD
jgi:uncharacterized repeat protein (TIGR03806 family)